MKNGKQTQNLEGEPKWWAEVPSAPCTIVPSLCVSGGLKKTDFQINN
jgi:hypothetical protein